MSTVSFPPLRKNCDMEIRALNVRQLNLYVKSLLEGDARLRSVAVTGELSNFKDHYASGHFYFTLKDPEASIRCVMFRSFASRLSFRPKDGDAVVIVGRVSLYEKDGQYQFYAEEMFPVGAGALAVEFEKIKAKLEAEGLFAPERKRPLPKFPGRIAVVTSPTGAAVQDILNILSRRYPLCEAVLCPVAVQGAEAVPDMLKTLDRVYTRSDIDLIILGRGGGSAEDLAAFNDELLARKIAASPVPVISAVGHETDFSISDFAADMRAPTPSAAAELAVPDRQELFAALSATDIRLKQRLSARYQYDAARLEKAEASPPFREPEAFFIGRRAEMTDRTGARLANAAKWILSDRESEFAALASKLDALSPLKTLARGFVTTAKEGKTVTSAKQLRQGDNITLRYRDGNVDCLVNKPPGFVPDIKEGKK